jgi:hypothetical protein
MMNPEITKEIRVEIRRYLYARPGAAMPLDAIHRAVRRSVPETTEADAAREIAVLVAREHLAEIADPDMPAVKGWKITADGINHHELHHV